MLEYKNIFIQDFQPKSEILLIFIIKFSSYSYTSIAYFLLAIINLKADLTLAPFCLSEHCHCRPKSAKPETSWRLKRNVGVNLNVRQQSMAQRDTITQTPQMETKPLAVAAMSHSNVEVSEMTIVNHNSHKMHEDNILQAK